jgi:hypothetical protein
MTWILANAERLGGLATVAAALIAILAKQFGHSSLGEVLSVKQQRKISIVII